MKTNYYIKLILLLLVGWLPVYASGKNIILMIGDGMGSPYLSALRYYQAANSQGNSTTIFDSMGVGMIRTNPVGKFKITDSAAGGTALATGEKTVNGRISISADMQPLESILNIAKKRGLKTGVVVTSSITDATPASFITTNDSRNNQNEIAYSYIQQIMDNQPAFDVLLGGGKEYFDKNPLIKVKLKRNKNLHYVTAFTELNIKDRRPEIGVFSEKELPYAIDNRKPSLRAMTNYTLQKLKNENGFFLLIESSQIDWCGHMNDIICAVNEMKDFSKTVELVKQFVNNHSDSLLVITADHSTGGLTIGSERGKYWNPSVIDKIHASGEKISKALISSNDITSEWLKYSDVPLNEQQWEEVKRYKRQNDQLNLRRYINNLISLTTNTGWTTESHTGEDVPVFAYGEHATMFHGFYDNTEIGIRIKKIIMADKLN
ncbi:alkaline phosphatase [Klebsiella aerogenes]|uniref:alkaline phosphatase n=1 Tax=Enterobacteriaceae TaxID=543 RepID=UPI000F816234|nr:MULTISPECIES: alkaline phosphatase [Enterobacteriaceae]MBT2090689.1 alkaline phosphatase [Enterobacter bugandensis]RTQ02471.1 alkaline phosphatase [Enterobacter sp. WCHEn045836]